MSMGFELQDCQDAVQYGKVNIEEAVEWLLGGKPGFVRNLGPPRLKLSRESGTELAGAPSHPFVNPVQIPAASVSSNLQSQSSGGEVPQGSPGTDVESENKHVVSRLHMNDEQRKYKQQYEEKIRGEAQRTAKEEKMKAKREHARILQQIAEDRDKQKMMRMNIQKSGSVPVTSAQSPPQGAMQSLSVSPHSSPEENNSDKCTLQIRLPSGQSLRQTFSVNNTLNTVWDFVCTKCKSMTNMCFIQPFPRREFTPEELGKTLRELGLTPSGSLVLKKQESQQGGANQSSGAENMPAEPNPVIPPAAPVPPYGPEEGMDMMPPFDRGDEQRGDYRWGRGHRMDNEQEEIPDQYADEDEDEDEMMENMFGNQFPGLPPIGGAGMQGGWGGGHGNQAFAGLGQRLVPDRHPGEERDYHSRPAAQLAAEAARQRYAQPEPGGGPLLADNPVQIHARTYSVSSLLQLCLQHLSRRLNDPRHPLLSLGGISEDLAQKILTQLKKEKLLKPKILQAFIPCYLRKLVLDCYPYTTNELLHAVRYHVHLCQLGVNSCPLITDSGLKAISALKKLRVLNLGSCRQLTNKCLSVVSELPNINSLNLEDTGITDVGLEDYLACFPKHLQHLNLSRTAVTHHVIPHLTALSSLKSLYLGQTKVCSLSGIQDLKELEILDVAHTDIITNSLLCLSGHPSLTCLSIANTENVVGDLALQYLTGLKLHLLYLPSRHSTTNEGLQHLTGLPLTALDLTNYINVGDEGMMHIGKITSLKTLLLSNTKITDEGMLYLQGLVNLEVLYLDRTLLSDVGAIMIKAFTKLQELSLSSTSVTSRFLLEGTLNSCHFLSKLNLSRTNISDRGVTSLKLGSLNLLNLDGTHVHPFIVEKLSEGCPNLTSVSVANLTPVREEEEDMDV